ncbi:methylenetetrahydrofolate reductase [NAD(P)H] [Hydrogenoanaerobacterium sp.]|uniref:methylenetetrahydrofolate reductase [NAD(P)H] n=1 Tax=Hydrogenoanaerobacterium sp. TaxID=2953763 RepID=UPI002899315B|nr:methylenetetrahydrofolate reductase [NAD(P)H] [Hydrogenoanaerobacterium sp.]
MSIANLFQKQSTVFSFEVFPPKRNSPIDTIYKTLDELQDLKPDFISVTYNAGGSGDPAKQPTCEIASIIKEKYGIPPLAHLTCVNSTREEISIVLDELKAKGVEDILALRGDINPDVPPKTDFAHASDLITFIKGQSGFSLSGACYPEGHCECADVVSDIHNLRKKVDAGAKHLISQLFFDNSAFYSFVERARIAGIDVPIEAGIMPVVNKNQIERMVSLCGASLPPKFTKMISRYDGHPEALRDAGIAYAVDQIVDLISNGVDGIHLYTMNNPYVARKISESISSLRTV